MSRALELIGKDAKLFQPLFITVDPERDTVAVMRDYVGSFHPTLIGLTGSRATIASVTGKYRVRFARVTEKGDARADYLVDHTSAVFLMGPRGSYVARFSFATTARQMADKLRAFAAKVKTK